MWVLCSLLARTNQIIKGSIINVGVTNNRALQKIKKIVEHIENIL